MKRDNNQWVGAAIGNGVTGAILCAMLLMPVAAWASAAAGGGLPMDGWVAKFLQSITGPWAKAFCIAGIVGGGGGLALAPGDMSNLTKTVLYLGLVCSLILGASSFIMSTGHGAEILAAGGW